MLKRMMTLGCALALFTGCGGSNPPAGTDAGPGGSDAPAPMGCFGEDGTTPCLQVGSTSMPAEPDLTCLGTATEPAAGTASDRTLRLVAFGTSTTPIGNGTFEVWTNNMVGGSDCGGSADCVSLTSGTDGTTTVSLDDGFFAYHVPANATAMTYEAIGYNRRAAAGATTDVVAIPSSLFNTALGLVRSGFMRDPAGGIMTGDVSDCAGDGMRGITVRISSGGTSVDFTSTAPMDPGLAYRANGVLPDARLRTTDFSGGYAAANLPTGTVRVEAFGVRTMGGAVERIACEEVTVGASAITILSLQPLRSDYPAGNSCGTAAP